jgi:hypothetical protein
MNASPHSRIFKTKETDMTKKQAVAVKAGDQLRSKSHGDVEVKQVINKGDYHHLDVGMIDFPRVITYRFLMLFRVPQ